MKNREVIFPSAAFIGCFYNRHMILIGTLIFLVLPYANMRLHHTLEHTLGTRFGFTCCLWAGLLVMFYRWR